MEVLDFEPGAASLFSALIEGWRSRVRSAAESLPQPSRGLFLSLTIGEQGFLAAGDPRVVHDDRHGAYPLHLRIAPWSHRPLVVCADQEGLPLASAHDVVGSLPGG